MPKVITFKVPTKDGAIEKTGFKVRLMVGNTRHMFVLQHDLSRPTILTDYRTGFKLASLGGLALARYVSNPYGYRDNLNGMRRIAQDWLNTIVADKGEQHVLDMLAKPATLNV
jgi:hypothetical protein